MNRFSEWVKIRENHDFKSILPRGTKLKLTQPYSRSTINGDELDPYPVGTMLTVANDYGGGRVNVFIGDEKLSEILYLSPFNAVVVN